MKVPALELLELSKNYPNGKKALEKVSFSVEEGDFFALLGPNGAGKSTLIGILCGLVQKTSGQINVFGHSIDREFEQAKTLMGIMPQEFNFNVFETVFEILINQAGYYGIPKKQAEKQAEPILERLKLWDLKDATARTLSGGMKRRLMIARALIHHPRLLVLDEPTAGVDIELRRSLWEFVTEINRQGTTIILTTHYLEEAENLCRNIAIIHQGSLIKKGPKKELLKTLQSESYQLELSTPVENPSFWPEYPECQWSDPHTLDITLKQDQTIGQFLSHLGKEGIQAHRIKNKTNRLEELFLHLTDHKRTER